MSCSRFLSSLNARNHAIQSFFPDVSMSLDGRNKNYNFVFRPCKAAPKRFTKRSSRFMNFLLHKGAFLSSSAGLLIGPYDAVVRRWRGLCDIEASHIAVTPEGVRSGPGPWRGDHGTGCAVSPGGSGVAGQGAVVSFLGLAGDLAALDQRVEGGRPEAVFATQQVAVIGG